jgi:hypothetical protein
MVNFSSSMSTSIVKPPAIPAHDSGAASRDETAWGTRVPNAASTTAYSAKDPFIEYPEFCCAPRNVAQPPMQ